ncbi:MAG: hypothetical protein ACYTAF_02030 [Planctomycetota bacterium]|jgi:hypothetical protein
MPTDPGIESSPESTLPRRRYHSVYREGDFFVVYNYLHQSRRYYANIEDVRVVMSEPGDDADDQY